MFNFVSQGLGVQGTSRAAAEAVSRICRDCGADLGAPVFHLHDSILQIRPSINARSSPLQLEDELNILKGLCHVIETLPFADARQALFTMAQPILIDIENTLKTNPQNGTFLVHDIERLTILSRSTRIDIPTGEMHPLVQVFERAWPLLQQCSRDYLANQYIAEKVCGYYKHTIRGSIPHFISQLPAMCEHLGAVFQASLASPYLYAGSICVEAFSDRAELIQILYQMLTTFSQTFFKLIRVCIAEMRGHVENRCLQTAAELVEHPDVFEEYYYLVGRYIQSCPGPLLQEADSMKAGPIQNHSCSARVLMKFLQLVIEAALAGVSVQHKEAQKGALHFFEQVIIVLLEMVVLTLCSWPSSLQYTVPNPRSDINWLLSLSTGSTRTRSSLC
jgi:hypothetical protein